MATNWEHTPRLAGQLGANDFGDDVVLLLEDGSLVSFRYAFVEEEEGFLVVYTEHCGYHVFYKDGAQVVTAGLRRSEEEKRADATWDRTWRAKVIEALLPLLGSRERAEQAADLVVNL